MNSWPWWWNRHVYAAVLRLLHVRRHCGQSREALFAPYAFQNVFCLIGTFIQPVRLPSAMTTAGRRRWRVGTCRDGTSSRRRPEEILTAQLAQFAHFFEGFCSLARLIRLFQRGWRLHLPVPKLMMIHHSAGALRRKLLLTSSRCRYRCGEVRKVRGHHWRRPGRHYGRSTETG